MSAQGQRGGVAAKIVAAAGPLLGAGALRLRRAAVVEEKARVAFQRPEVGLIGKDERGANEVAAPIAAALVDGGVEEGEIDAGRGRAVIAIGGVKVADPILAIDKWRRARFIGD